MTHGRTAPPATHHFPTSICLSEERRLEATCFFLGLFSLTPALLLLHEWATLPVMVIAGAALRSVYLLHRSSVEAVTLHISTWLMTVLSISITLMTPPFIRSEALAPYSPAIFSFSLSGLVIFPTFALISLLYGLRKQIMTQKQLLGICFSSVHTLTLMVLIAIICLQGWNL